MKKKLSRRLLAIFLTLVLIVPNLAFAAESNGQTAETEAPVFKDVSVHDPSVIKTGDTYYVFGSHLAAAKTKDFMQWDEVANIVSPDNPLFENVVEELKESFDWAESDTLWAADVIELNGKFYMYYNACKGDSPRSAMGIAVSDNIEGPYKDKGIFLKSGMWDQESPDGTIYDAREHPNAVDPDVFFDKDGKLWMMYGSYSGGIFIMQMNPETGEPLPDQGYGKKLLGGNHSRIEGAYVQYSKETDYYYMYLSFGGLDAVGGYNMRVVRSKNPDGPYVDAQGHDMINVKANPELPIFDDASIEPYGVKLMGSHLFKREVGEPGTGIGTGYVSPGHNSVYYDEATDEQYLIFHARFPQKGEMHQVRVHKMYMNEDGWPVVSPHRYAGESLEKVDAEEISGDYKFINHGKDISADIKESVLITLNADNTISGNATGEWSFDGENKATIEVGGKIYKGVFNRQWDQTTETYVMTFSALSDEGVAVWGSKTVTQTDEEIIESVKNELSLGDTSKVISNLTLPTKGSRDTQITWTSSNSEIVSEEGKVIRPIGTESVTVTLTATITKGNIVDTKTFEITVLPQKEGKLVARYTFDGNLSDSTENVADGTITGNRIDNTGGTSSFEEGKLGQAAVFNGETGIRLPDGLISSNKYSVSLWLNPEELTEFTTTFFGASSNTKWLSLLPKGHGGVANDTMLWSGEAWYDAGTGMKIPVDEWSHVAFTVDNGSLQIYVNGEEKFAGKGFPDVFTTENGVFGLGVNYWDVPYKGLMDDLLVYDAQVLTAEEIKAYYETGEVPVYPEVEEPGTEEPGTDEPGTDEPGTEEPGTEEPGTEEPGTEHPGSKGTIDNIDALIKKANLYTSTVEASAFTISKEVIESLPENSYLQLTNGAATAKIPVSLLKTGENIQFSFGEDLANEYSFEDAKPVGEVLDFTITSGDEVIEEFGDTPITLTFSINADEDTNLDNVVVLYINEQKQYEKVETKQVDIENKTISVDVEHFSIYGAYEVADRDNGTPADNETPGNTDTIEQPKENKPVTDVKADPVEDGQSQAGKKLPNTATRSYNMLLIGAFVLIAGAAIFIYVRRKASVE
ncbi:family 43 glycosylhydrolase [Metabacillus malikii]|uniref:Arabinan endo-1,5-alpha-L-arabinosidase n=1 Tax=Metabacillus malikii TaxID=1504265 RepID=A0ABT9ZHA0_9BACI|nr:family 43 glycosylhydrolase [Metabacillus malikii]MDQ0231672.1 arabinan endo-1,5-alpha-L-arabinosidase [Metabacillus malikii]